MTRKHHVHIPATLTLLGAILYALFTATLAQASDREWQLERERYVHMVLDLPWPISDRDMVIHTVTTIDPTTRTATVSLDSVSDKIPATDLIRAETSGSFQLRVLGPEETEFTYMMQTDLRGDLPAGTVNGRMASSAYNDLRRLRKLAER